MSFLNPASAVRPWASEAGDAAEELRLLGHGVDRGRDGLAENGPVVLGDDPRVGDDHYAAVGFGADQPPEALAEADHRLRQRVVAERTAALALHPLGARLGNRVSDLREGEPGDDHARKRLAGDVHSLPERLGAEEHGALAFLQCARQRLAGSSLALYQELERRLGEGLGRGGGDGVHHLVAGEEDERAALGGGAYAREGARKRGDAGALVGGGVGQEVRRQHQRLAEVVEGTGGGEEAEALLRAEPPRHVAEVAADAERGGAEDGGVLAAVEDVRELLRHRERRGDEADVAAAAVDAHAFDPVDVVVLLFAGDDERGLVREGEQAVGIGGEDGGDVGVALVRGVGEVVEAVDEANERGLERALEFGEAGGVLPVEAGAPVAAEFGLRRQQLAEEGEKSLRGGGNGVGVARKLLAVSLEAAENAVELGQRELGTEGFGGDRLEVVGLVKD